MKRKLYVYVAGPIASGPLAGFLAAYKAANLLMDHGLIPFVPHFNIFSRLTDPLPITAEGRYQRWLPWDFAWIDKCDVLLRLPGDSPGSDDEVKHAHSTDKPVFYSVQDVLDYANIHQGEYEWVK